MTSGSTGEKIKEKAMGTKDKVKEKAMGTKDKVKEKAMGTKDKVKETMGMGSGSGGGEGRKGEEGPGAADEVEEEVGKTSSDSPTKNVDGSGKALGKEEGAAE